MNPDIKAGSWGRLREASGRTDPGRLHPSCMLSLLGVTPDLSAGM